jgi:hypothetical protein
MATVGGLGDTPTPDLKMGTLPPSLPLPFYNPIPPYKNGIPLPQNGPNAHV